jgi:protein arginine kinase activator
MTFQSILQQGKAGCADCYSTFRRELDPLITSLQGGVPHNGEAPSRQRARLERLQKIESLKKDLQEQIRLENFEQAARLRDELKNLKNEDKEGDCHGMV